MWFAPSDSRPPLGFHDKPERWNVEGERVHLKSVARGQEFALDTRSYPEAVPWVTDLFQAR